MAVAEMQVASVGLRFVNARTGETREDGPTRPDTILRHLTTRPGRVSSWWNLGVLHAHAHHAAACGNMLLWQSEMLSRAVRRMRTCTALLSTCA